MEFCLICGENSVEKISENWDRCKHKLVSNEASDFDALDRLLDMLKPSRSTSPLIIKVYQVLKKQFIGFPFCTCAASFCTQ